MKLKKYFKIVITNLINLQLFLTPMISYGTENSGNDAVKVMKAFEEVGTGVLKGIQQGVQQNQQIRAQNQAQQSMETLRVRPLSTTDTNPILAQAGCAVLPAESNKPSLDLQCKDPATDFNTATFYKNLQVLSEQNANFIKQFTKESNVSDASVGVLLPDPVGTTNPSRSFGKSCYDRAKKIFTTQLKSRVQAINEFQNFADRKAEEFSRLTEQNLDQIRSNTALLTGEDPSGRFLRNLRIEDSFTDPACVTLMGLDEFKEIGAGGLKAIEVNLKTKRNQAREFSDKTRDFGPELSSILNQIDQSINNSDLNDLKLQGGITFSSRLGLEQFPAFQSILGRVDIERENDVKTLKNNLTKLGAGNNESAILDRIIGGNSKDPISEINNFERRTKNDCLNNLMQSNFNGTEGLLSRLENPNISQKLNREADNAFKNFISETLSDNNLTIEEKIKLIRDEEARSNNTKLSLVTGKSITFRGQQIGASTRLKASDLLGVFEGGCRDIFDNEQNDQGSTKRDAIELLKNAAQNQQFAKRNLISNVRSSIKRDLLDCTSNTNPGVGANSCKDAIDTQSPNFCFKNAQKCSENTVACFQKTEFEVKRLEDENNKKALEYKQSFELLFKTPLTVEFAALEKSFKESSRQLDGLFKAGTLFETPKELNLDLTATQNELLEGIDPGLQVADPKAFATRIKENFDKLKEKVEKQNDELLQALDEEISKINQNHENEQNFWQQLAQDCKSAVEAFNQQQEQVASKQNDKVDEQNKKSRDLCTEVDALNSNPLAGSPGDLAEELLKSSITQGETKAIAQLRELERIRNATNNETNNPFLDGGGPGKSKFKQLTISEFCAEDEAKDFKFECDRFKEFCFKDGGKQCDNEDIPDNTVCYTKDNKFTKDTRLCKKDDANKQNIFVDVRTLSPKEKLEVRKIINPKCKDAKEKGEACVKFTGQLRTLASQLSQSKAIRRFGQIQVGACKDQPVNRFLGKALNTVGEVIGEGIGKKATKAQGF